jgi:PAS domain S-box-containing protein
MEPVSVLYTAFASIALFTCLLQIFLALKKSGDVLTHISAVLSFLIFIRYSLIFFFSGPLGDTENHLTLLRCELILTQIITICMIGLIFKLLKDARRLFILLHVSIIAILLILCFILPDDIFFGSNEGFNPINITHDDSMFIVRNGFTWWRAITDLTILLFAFSTYVLLMKKLKTVQYKKIVVFFAGVGLILLSAIYDQFVDLGVINSIYLLPFSIFLLYMVLNFIPFLYLLEEVAESNVISQEEIKFRRLIYDADIIVVGLNRMGHVDYVNPFFLEFTGYKENEVLGKDWFEFFIPAKESYHVQGAFIDALASDFQAYYENPILNKIGKERMIRWFNVRTRDKNENITGSLSIGVDITEDLWEKEDLHKKLKTAQDLINNLKKQ